MTLTKLIAAAFLSLGLASITGCVAAPIEAPAYARIQEIEDVSVSWQGCARDAATGLQDNPNCRPSNAVLFRLDTRVYNVDTFEPMNNIRIWFTSGYSDVYLLPEEVLEAISIPTEYEGWREVSEEQGELWAEFAGTFEGDYRPTYHEGFTDRRGLASVWVWINTMPVDETGTPVETNIFVGITSDSMEIPLTPAE